jgi:tRNA nucleotidyltransferase/poly(A) polymerase
MNIRECLNNLFKISKEYGIDTPYVVGGLPRDILLNSEVKSEDIDITTNTPDILLLAVLFAKENNFDFKLLKEGHALVFCNGIKFDFSTHTIHDEVVDYLKAKDIDQNLYEVYSRDFTINTLHMHPITEQIFDPTEMGKQDVASKLLRTPVPAHITLAADPRRAFRAIKFAVTYNLSIHEDIVSFCRQNKTLLKEDEYASVAIDSVNQSFEKNEELTYKLLLDLNILDCIPLSGKLKEYLIKNKKIYQYFVHQDIIEKKAEFIAYDWLGYESQGPDFKDLASFWKQNWQKIPGVLDSSYQGWKNWYKKIFKQAWEGEHKPPKEVKKILEDYINIKSGPIQEAIKQELYEAPEKDRKLFDFLHLKQDGVEIQGLPFIFRKSRDIEISPMAYSFLKSVSEKINFPIIITSGKRSLEEQASAMWKNMKKGGFERLIKTYPDELVKEMQFAKSKQDVLNILIKKQQEGYSISAHLSGEALDFRTKDLSSEQISELTSAAKESGAKTLNEGDHLHVQFGKFA